jgi:hypothetical protein
MWRDYYRRRNPIRWNGKESGEWSITTIIAPCYVRPSGPASSKQHLHLIIGLPMYIVIVSIEGRAPLS